MLHPTPAAERAYDHVKQAIITGDIRGGDMLSEGEVATSLEMSRTPVREAFLRLEVEGFLTLYPKRGALVTPISEAEIRDVYDARALIDAHAAAHICGLNAPARTAVAKALTELVGKQNAALEEADLAEYARLDAEFHQAIMDHGGNAILAQLGRSLRERQQRFTAAAIGRNVTTAHAFVASHTRLVEALRAGDLAAYDKEITQHLNLSRNQL